VLAVLAGVTVLLFCSPGCLRKKSEIAGDPQLTNLVERLMKSHAPEDEDQTGLPIIGNGATDMSAKWQEMLYAAGQEWDLAIRDPEANQNEEEQGGE
jgi:hypothetical protein